MISKIMRLSEKINIYFKSRLPLNLHSIGIISIILLAAMLGLHGLGDESFWFDEISSIDQATANFFQPFHQFHLSPLYFLILKCWINIGGTSEFYLRLPSVIFFVLTVFLLWRLGKIMYNTQVGILASLLFAISPFHIFYAQEVRQYSLFALLAVLSMLLFLSIVKKKFIPSRSLSACYITATLLLLHTHLWAICIIIIQNIYVALNRVKPVKFWLISQTIIFLLFLPWLIFFCYYFFTQKAYMSACLEWITEPNLRSIWDLFCTFIYGGHTYGGGGFYIDSAKIAFSSFLPYFHGVLFLLGLLFFYKNNKRYFIILGLWFFMPILLLYIFSYTVMPVFVGRYLIFITPAYFIIVAGGIKILKGKVAKALAVVLLVLLSLPPLDFYYKTDRKADWRSAIEYLYDNSKPDDLIIVSRADHTLMLEYKKIIEKKVPLRIDIARDLRYKINEGGFKYIYDSNVIYGVKDNTQLKEMFDSGFIDDSRNFWLVLGNWAQDPEMTVDYLSSFFDKKSKKTFKGVEVYRYLAIAE